ncbi:MAG: nucleoside triphosphate pyrophosphohydrolase [Clostridia bacterium]|nr:nucleoside triphosphate pyrophosphohydrolase [Clostridia bacterium]
MITLIGLGIEKGDLTGRALAALKQADKVLLRTGKLPSADGLREAGIEFETLDELYEKSRNWDTLAKNIAAEVKRQAKGKDLCYCVDGSITEDRAAQLLIGEDVHVIEGVGKGAAAAARAGLGCSFTSVSAYEITGRRLTLPLVVYDVADKLLAGDVKLALTELFGDEAPALYINGETEKRIPLCEADRQSDYGEHTAIVVYGAELLEKKRFCLEDLMDILRRLRAPDGCPWDRVQTHESIRINAIEEAYELVDAIDSDDPDKMCEEAGDVMMQAAFHTLIEEERGGFTLTDVLSGVCEKLISRHTHVFGEDKATGAESALSVWDKNKMTEKGQKTYSDSVNDVPKCFPALLRAQKIAKRMAKGGWNFTAPEDYKKKFAEEAEELTQAVRSGDKGQIAAEFGDILMVLMHAAHLLGIDSEQALLDTVKKNAARFTEWERLVLADGKDVHNLTDEEWHTYYKRAKENVSRD